MANPSVALSSAIFLAAEPDRPASSADPAGLESTPDGQSTSEQIVRTWDLDADLVVLSACESGLGRYAGGEGYLGFAQALFVKGAKSLVLSQWKVDDKATALLMTRFYQNLLGCRAGLSQPLPKAEALDEANSTGRPICGVAGPQGGSSPRRGAREDDREGRGPSTRPGSNRPSRGEAGVTGSPDTNAPGRLTPSGACKLRTRSPATTAAIREGIRFREPPGNLSWRKRVLPRRSRPREDVGGQVGQAELRFPVGRVAGLAPRLVQPNQPLHRLGQAGPVRRGDSRLADHHPLVAPHEERFGLGVLALA
jgi:hypothetical protein